MDKKVYGFIPAKKFRQVNRPAKSIFESDSDDDGPSRQTKKETAAPKSFKAKIAEQKFVEDDPSIYEYDNIYDSIKQQTTEKKTETKRKEPRFIQSLLKAADKRKKDHDRRLEKKIQTERIKEGDEFQDKEAFVTSAYKEKMQEMEKEEEKERVQNHLDEMMDVTKQKDLSGFYRHYLKQTMGEEAIPGKSKAASSDKTGEHRIKIEHESSRDHTVEKSIRRRCSSSSEDDKPMYETKRSHSRKEERDNIKEEDEANTRKRHRSSSSPDDRVQEESSKITKHVETEINEDADDDDVLDTDSEDENKTAPQETNKKSPKSAMSVKFEKRTVGEVFDQAQARYFKRVASRGT